MNCSCFNLLIGLCRPQIYQQQQKTYKLSIKEEVKLNIKCYDKSHNILNHNFRLSIKKLNVDI
jgi:hypothetical protein